MDKSTGRTETVRRERGYRMRSAKVVGCLTIALGVVVPGIVAAQSPAPATVTAPQASPPATAARPADSPRADEMAPVADYGYPPAYSPGGYGYPPPPPESMEGFHSHDGFYFRVQPGIGFTSLSSTKGGVKTTLGGGGFSTGGAIGGVVAHNLVLFAAIFNTSAVDPDVKVGGTSTASPIGEIVLQGFGPGVAYYFEPINLYLSGTVAIARFWANDTNGNQLDTSKIGLAFELQVGKEWWVSRDWGLGVALGLVGGSMKDQNDPTLTWSAGAFSFLFSATYN
jgi:hypothetical protein